MLDDFIGEIITYRLRASNPMPVSGGDFVLHTFGAEKIIVEIYDCVESLPSSEDFVGQGGTYTSASFSKINTGDGEYFKGKMTYTDGYPDNFLIDEDQLPFNPWL